MYLQYTVLAEVGKRDNCHDNLNNVNMLSCLKWLLIALWLCIFGLATSFRNQGTKICKGSSKYICALSLSRN